MSDWPEKITDEELETQVFILPDNEDALEMMKLAAEIAAQMKFQQPPGLEADTARSHSEPQPTRKRHVRIDDIYSGSSLKASDLRGKAVTVEIESYEVKEFEQKGKDGPYMAKKIVLSFKGKDKTLVVNKTNARRIESMHGPDIDDWLDKEIVLQPEKVEFGNDMVDAIRVRLPEAPVEFDDDIPF